MYNQNQEADDRKPSPVEEVNEEAARDNKKRKRQSHSSFDHDRKRPASSNHGRTDSATAGHNAHDSSDERDSVHAFVHQKQGSSSSSSAEESDEATASANEEGKPRSLSFFPMVLMEVLSKEDVQHVMWWLPDGLVFAVKPQAFVETVIPKYFHGISKFTSFKRKLNRWGFRRLLIGEPGAFAYSHRLFQRDFPALCKGMSGGKRAEQDLLSSALVMPQQNDPARALAADAFPSSSSAVASASHARIPAEAPAAAAAAMHNPVHLVGQLEPGRPPISVSETWALLLKQEFLLQEARSNAYELDVLQRLENLYRQRLEEDQRLRREQASAELLRRALYNDGQLTRGTTGATLPPTIESSTAAMAPRMTEALIAEVLRHRQNQQPPPPLHASSAASTDDLLAEFFRYRENQERERRRQELARQQRRNRGPPPYN